MKLLSTLTMFAGLLMFTALGCGDQAATSTETPPADPAGATDEGHDDHDHDGEDADDVGDLGAEDDAAGADEGDAVGEE